MIVPETPYENLISIEVATGRETLLTRTLNCTPDWFQGDAHRVIYSNRTPGLATDRTPQQGAASTSGLTFGGQRARSNNITVDGLDNNDVFMGAVRATFSQEAVQEFQVIANSFPAEFGKASGGIVNVALPSVRADLEACYRLDPSRAFCLFAAPSIYEYSFLNGVLFGVRFEVGP